LLAVSVAGASLLTHQALAAKQAAVQQGTPAPATAKDTKPAAPVHPLDKADQTVEVTGQVLGADGKLCEGAKVFLWNNAVKKQADMAPLATTGDDGRFRLRVAPGDLQRDAKIVARAQAHGPDWVEVAKVDKGGEVTLRLAPDDVPILGRVIDLEGQPVAG